jgi:adenosine deaminase
MTRVVPSVELHPLPRLLEAGLVVTLNSDDPSMFSSPLTGEYELVRRTFRLDDEALAAIVRNGVRASFADDAMKAEIEQGIDRWLDSPG